MNNWYPPCFHIFFSALSSYFYTINKGKNWDSSSSSSTFVALSNLSQLSSAVLINLWKFSSLYGRLLDLSTIAGTSKSTWQKQSSSLSPNLLLFYDLLLALSSAHIHRIYFSAHLSLLSCPAPISIHSRRFSSHDASQSLPFLSSLLLPPWLKYLFYWYLFFVCAPAAAPNWFPSFQFLSFFQSLLCRGETVCLFLLYLEYAFPVKLTLGLFMWLALANETVTTWLKQRLKKAFFSPLWSSSFFSLRTCTGSFIGNETRETEPSHDPCRCIIEPSWDQQNHSTDS